MRLSYAVNQGNKMNRTEKAALRESVIVVIMGVLINFPLQTLLLWLTIDIWSWKNTLLISIFIQSVITFVALVRVFSIRMSFSRRSKRA
tara:strand:+ start:3817 stop:4083 length:267 start_codon:yes stop_codon:yes gene_type:complete